LIGIMKGFIEDGLRYGGAWKGRWDTLPFRPHIFDPRHPGYRYWKEEQDNKPNQNRLASLRRGFFIADFGVKGYRGSNQNNHMEGAEDERRFRYDQEEDSRV